MDSRNDIALDCGEARLVRAHADLTGRQTAIALAQLQVSIDQRRLLLAFRRQAGDAMLRAARRAVRMRQEEAP
jgi:hypothetical protein